VNELAVAVAGPAYCSLNSLTYQPIHWPDGFNQPRRPSITAHASRPELTLYALLNGPTLALVSYSQSLEIAGRKLCRNCLQESVISSVNGRAPRDLFYGSCLSINTRHSLLRQASTFSLGSNQ